MSQTIPITDEMVSRKLIELMLVSQDPPIEILVQMIRIKASARAICRIIDNSGRVPRKLILEINLMIIVFNYLHVKWALSKLS